MSHKVIIAFGADHAGYEMKQELISYAKELGHNTIDFGTDNTEPYDYPLIVPMVVETVRNKAANFGVIICGSGIGVDIVANRFRGIRSALCHNAEIAKSARAHNDANILCLGSRFISLETAKECLKRFLETPFSTDERHHRRVQMIDSFM